MPKQPITPTAAARIQSATAKEHGGKVPLGSFATRAQRTAAINTNLGVTPPLPKTDK